MSSASDDIRTVPQIGTTSSELAFDLDTRRNSDWLNPIAMSTLKRAVDKKAKTCVLNGTQFTIEYGHKTKLAVTEDRPCIWVSPTDEGVWAPCGYIALETLEKFRFES